MAYVDADKFAEEICNFPAIDEDSANAVISLLRRQPTADVEEVRHGEWIKSQKLYGIGVEYVCSLCGRTVKRGDLELYCHCGAKMDGGKI